MDPGEILVMTGPPAAGKTTVAELIGRTISIQTAPDVESATRCQVLVAQAGIVQNLVSGPYTSLEDMIALQS
jgi:replication-associated recombination protein RarA